MAWQIGSLTIPTSYGPYDLERPGAIGGSQKIKINRYPLLGGGDRTNTSLLPKEWSFRLFNVSSTDATTIRASIYGGEFYFYDDYDSAWYTVKAVTFSDFSPLNRDKTIFQCTMRLQEVVS